MIVVASRVALSITLSNVRLNKPSSTSRSNERSSGIESSSMTLRAGSPSFSYTGASGLPAKSYTPSESIEIKVFPSSVPPVPNISSSTILL